VQFLGAVFSRSIDSRINKGVPRLALDVYQRITIPSPHFNRHATAYAFGKYLISDEISLIKTYRFFTDVKYALKKQPCGVGRQSTIEIGLDSKTP